MDKPEGIAGLEAVGIGEAGTGAGPAGVDGVLGTGFGGCGVAAAVVEGFVSRAGFLQTLDENPNAGTAAGGDEARGAYLSRDASARLASKESSRTGSLAGSRGGSLGTSRRPSLALKGSVTTDERREYESTGGPRRSDADGWCAECGVDGPVGVPGM